ncbi:rhombotarget lipoprotein [Stenotrophomonas mori]|uniref:Rhombotarget lipoprotein n=1 Tax=Stenotrophomonas mori TaxID=2871096 RepID=A0ABT0SH90_9GAMM|nr:rhombotarget lipoprotein [Stenotrophomonas mori]MCL7714706.1 rhombotarget lipoprotein [Stenotrophomonas mori]
MRSKDGALRARMRVGAAAALVLLLAGCATLFDGGQRRGVSSSVVDYLYPKGEAFKPADESATPQVRLPARVGLMFVPSRNDPMGVGPAEQSALLEKVRSTFKEQPFIERIEVIPGQYLRPGGGFDNLEQVARMHGVDLVALVSYDQIVRTDQNAASLLYWTLVGAYTIHGNRNQVSTFVDTSVFDVASRALLFRAPGTDQRDAGSTAVRVDEVQGRLAGESFTAAMGQMTTNLDTAIADFAVRAREEGQVKLVDRRSGGEWRRGGGGSVRGWELVLLAGAGLLLLRRR